MLKIWDDMEEEKLGLHFQKYLMLSDNVIRSLIIKFLLKCSSLRTATRMMCFRHISFDCMKFKLADILRRKDLEVNVKVTMAAPIIS